MSGVESKIAEYRKGLSNNAALENLKGTPDQWMLDDDAYVASVLRESAGGSATVQAKAADAPYTLSDLDALGQYASALSAMEKPNNTNIYTMDEARIGLDFSMLAMKTDALRNSGKIGNTMAGLLQKTMDSFMQSFLDRLDGQLSANRNVGAIVERRVLAIPADRSYITVESGQTAESYTAGLRQKYITALALAGAYVLLYVIVWCVIGSMKRKAR